MHKHQPSLESTVVVSTVEGFCNRFILETIENEILGIFRDTELSLDSSWKPVLQIINSLRC